MDIAEFIRARLDEDEAAARAAAGRAPGPWVGAFKQVTSEPSSAEISIVATTEWSDTSHHIERWEPARALREVAAKRAILAIHEPLPSVYGEPPVCGACWPQPRPGTHPLWPCSTVRPLAAVYSDHPDYRAEWKPRS
jgi:Family of unknown function (DUF6221)